MEPHFTYPILSQKKELFHGTFLSAPEGRFIASKQVHGTDLVILTSKDQPLPPCDALATHLANYPLMVRHADCQAALLYDPVNKVIAAIHAGWRGLVNGIYPKTIHALQKYYGSQPNDLLIAIAPSLGKENSQFLHYKEEIPERFWSFQFKPFYFDLKAIAQAQLMQAGVLSENLYISEIDTADPSTPCPSYRRDKTPLRMGSVIALGKAK